MLYAAFGVGVYGYLFPGNINTLMMHLSGKKNYKLLAGIFFLALLFEFLYCYTAISCYSLIGENTAIARILSWLGCIMGFGMGSWILLEKNKRSHEKTNSMTARGIISIIIHPQQVVFWLYVYALLMPFGNIGSATSFALSNVCGCALIFSVYIWGGTRLLQKYQHSEKYLHKAVGLLYLLSSLVTASILLF